MEDITYADVSGNTTYIVQFEWTEMPLMPIIEFETRKFGEDGARIEDGGCRYNLFSHSGYFHAEAFEKITLRPDCKRKASKKKRITGVGAMKIGNTRLFELAHLNQTVSLDIHGKDYHFLCAWKENGGNDKVVLHMEIVGREHAVYFEDAACKEEKVWMEREASKRNEILSERVQNDISKKRLQQMYQNMSFWRKFLGGMQLKKKHHVA